MSAFTTTKYDDGMRITEPTNMREHRENKRAEAKVRQENVKHDDTKAHRLGKCDCENVSKSVKNKRKKGKSK